MQERLWSGYFNARSSGVKLFSDIFRSDGLKTPAWLKTRLTLDGLAAATFAMAMLGVCSLQVVTYLRVSCDPLPS